MLLLIKSRVQPFMKTTNTVEEQCRFKLGTINVMDIHTTICNKDL